MKLTEWFKKDEQQESQPANPSFTLMIRVLAVAYLAYCLWQIVKLYMAGGEDAPSLTLLIVAIAVLGGGAVWVAVVSYKEWRRAQAAEKAALDAEDAAMEQEEE